MGTAADREFYVDAVLPALATRLDAAFPEFGWRQDARGWVATNEEMTHRVLGVRADRVVAHGPTPSGFLVHGGSETLWTAYLNGGVVPRNETFREVVVELAARAGVGLARSERSVPRDRRADLLHDFYGLCQTELRGRAGDAVRSYLEGRGFPAGTIERRRRTGLPGAVLGARSGPSQTQSFDGALMAARSRLTRSADHAHRIHEASAT